MRGFLTILTIVLVAGGIAYIGDRVGHQVGRRRLTLFGLRPRYTSTIFAVGFGMLIALLVVGIVSLVSYDARQALFAINRLNQQISGLTRERDRLVQVMQEDPIVFRFGEPLSQPVVVSSNRDEATIEKELQLLFVNVARQSKNVPDVRPYPNQPLTATAKAKISELAKLIKSFAPLAAVVAPVAGENIFRGGNMNISLEVFKDKLLYRKGEIISSVVVRDAKNPDLARSALFQLVSLIVVSATSHGMPPMLADNPTTSPRAADRALAELAHISGAALVKAAAADDIYAEGPLRAAIVVSSISPR